MSLKDWTDDKLIARLIKNKSEKGRWDKIAILRMRPSEELFTKCVGLTQSTHSKEKIIGIDILAQFGESPRPFLQQTLAIYFELLDVEIQNKTLMSILCAIGHNNEILTLKQIEKICSFVDYQDDEIKQSVVFALLGVDVKQAINVLIQLSVEQKNDVRNWATFGLGTLINRDTQKIRAALWQRTNDKHRETRLEAILGLARRKDQRVHELIRQELIYGEYGKLLFEAIIETKNKAFLPLLKQNLDNENDPTWIVDLQGCIDELVKLT